LPVILHEANAIPGKVTWFSPWCSAIALGFEPAAQYLPRTKTIYTGTPVRSQFGMIDELPPLSCPKDVPHRCCWVAAAGINQLVRQCPRHGLMQGLDSSFDWENDPDA